jgi:hypothetical protein
LSPRIGHTPWPRSLESRCAGPTIANMTRSIWQ